MLPEKGAVGEPSRTHQHVLASPPGRVLPESARWLVTKGRIEEAKKVLQKAAATNKRSLPPELLEQVLGGSCPQTLPWALQQPLELSSAQKSLSIPTGDGHWLWGTPAPAELHRDKVREEAQLLLRLSLELSGVPHGDVGRTEMLPWLLSCEDSTSVTDEHRVSV